MNITCFTWRRLACNLVILSLAPILGAQWVHGQDVLVYEVENWTEPKDAWQDNKTSEDKWNLWSTDTDAARKWSGAVVLQSPRVLKDREKPEDGAPVLHTRITGIPAGKYSVELSTVGRGLAVSFDGRTWEKKTSSDRGLGVLEIKDGTFDLWVDDRYANPENPGSTYYDAIIFTPILSVEDKLPNGGFEQMQDGFPKAWWFNSASASASPTETEKHGGERALHIASQTDGSWEMRNSISLLAPATAYLLASAWVKCDEGTLELAITGIGPSGPVRICGSRTIGPTQAWDEVRTGAIVPPGCDQVRLAFRGKQRVSAWIDDVATVKAQPTRRTKPGIQGYAGERIRERMGRGMLAVPIDGHRIYLGWRLLADDPADVAFNVYRCAAGEQAVRVNDTPITRTTDFIDSAPQKDAPNEYFVRAVTNGVEGPPSESASARPEAEGKSYLSLRLNGDHTFQKAGIVDLNNDGRYDFVLKQPNENIDPAASYWKPSPDTYKVEAYLHDGTFLWRKDLGWSIERGIWYSPMIAYDLDGDGRAEVALKTGEGDPRDPDGHVTSGPEYLSILDGMTGEEKARVDWPTREGFDPPSLANRNQLCVAYLDGKTPCLIVERGTYTIIKLVAYEYQNGKLRELWRWTSDEEEMPFRGMGGHTMHAVDVDGDGRDEIIIGSACVDDNGTGLWTTGMGHPDHSYVGDLDPTHPGLEIYYGIESRQAAYAMNMVDAKSGSFLWGLQEPTKHVHSAGLCSDFDALYMGMECLAGERDFKEKRWIFSAQGKLLSNEQKFGIAPRAVYWDADPQREMVLSSRIFDYPGDGPPHLSDVKGAIIGFADILGDWREELITTLPGELRIYTTTIPAIDRRVCLMQDPIYRLDVAIQAMGYTCVPTLSYCIAAAAPSMRLLPPHETPQADSSIPLQIAVVAPLTKAAGGALRLSAESDASVSPGSLDVSLAPGEMKTVDFEVSTKADEPRTVTVTAQWDTEQGLLSDAISVKFVDHPISLAPSEGVKVQAEDFSAQGGGEVHVRTDKVGHEGKSLSHWDETGHWLEWKLTVPQKGGYCLLVRFCAAAEAQRAVTLDGKPLGEGTMRFPPTGGFSATANDWRHLRIGDAKGEPIVLTLDAGDHILRMTNSDSKGLNLDYIALIPPRNKGKGE